MSDELDKETEAWLAQVPAPLQGVAKRHGSTLFNLVLSAGTIGVALGRLASQTRGNRACTEAILVLQHRIDALVKAHMEATGLGLENFQACRRDIELIGQLADNGKGQPTDVKSPSGIILNS